MNTNENKDVANRLLCPIFDQEKNPMNAGDSFSYQPGTPYHCKATIYMHNGVEWLSFSDGTPSTPLADFWYAPTDETISVLLNQHPPHAMTDQKTTETATPLQSLNRAIIRGLTRSLYAGDIIADRLEELERERDSAQLREAELAKALKLYAGYHGSCLPCHRDDADMNDAEVCAAAEIDDMVNAALQHHESQNNPKETKA